MQDNGKLLQQLQSGFKRNNLSKYQLKESTLTQNRYQDYLIEFSRSEYIIYIIL